MLDFKMKVIIKLSASYNYCCWSINYLIKNNPLYRMGPTIDLIFFRPNFPVITTTRYFLLCPLW